VGFGAAGHGDDLAVDVFVAIGLKEVPIEVGFGSHGLALGEAIMGLNLDRFGCFFLV
jgi:hypothetical protein